VQRVILLIIRNGTSVISIYVAPKKRLDDVTNMLSEEIGKASNVKDKINRLSI
jgi:peptide subunit release factor 1 (eRF1)